MTIPIIRDRIMSALDDEPDIGVHELREITGMAVNRLTDNLQKMVAKELVIRLGTRRHYQYRLTAKGKKELTGRKVAQARKQPARKENHVFSECRKNWQGYRIHKIFGSAGR